MTGQATVAESKVLLPVQRAELARPFSEGWSSFDPRSMNAGGFARCRRDQRNDSQSKAATILHLTNSEQLYKLIDK
jgi:hypothetical protein